ncbi:MAG: hypothetical protein VX667_04230 [Nitrospinota bacterium]|nr:hypothetical protein [Nitrospinota bacterium]
MNLILRPTIIVSSKAISHLAPRRADGHELALEFKGQVHGRSQFLEVPLFLPASLVEIFL